jgi:ribulose-5-phosphate 4-epimerase/fuculose-1-phosphate aldolase
MAANADLAEQLNISWRFFFRHGFIDGFGHISARTEDSNVMLISRHSLGADSGKKDFLLADLEGNILEGEGGLPGEWPIHAEIFKNRPDTNGIAHFHCGYATSFSMSNVPLKPSYFLATIFEDTIPIHPDPRLVNSPARGAALAATLGAGRAALLKAHGVVVAGENVVGMTAGAFILEDNAKRRWIAASMGEVESLEGELARTVADEILEHKAPFKRIWALAESEYDG